MVPRKDGDVRLELISQVGGPERTDLLTFDHDHDLGLHGASLMDYLLPMAMGVPHIESDHIETSAPGNELGVKGAGEAGAIPVGPLFAQALDDAFADVALEIREIPLSPNRLFEIVEEAHASK